MGFIFNTDSITPDSGSGGGGSAVIDTLTITPTTSQQTITAPSGTDGYSPITVNAVTSSIDANITANNIINGVSILGVSGNATVLNGDTLSVTPTTSAQTLTPTNPKNGFTQVSVSAVTSSIDNNIIAENIKKDVTILNVTGTYEGGGNFTKYGITINTLLGDVDSDGQLQYPTDQTDLIFTGVKKLINDTLCYKFYKTNIKNVSFPDLEQATGDMCLTHSFDYSAVETASFPKLTELDYAGYIFTKTNLTSISFPNLTTIYGGSSSRGLYYGFYNTLITEFDFPELTTIIGNGYTFAYFCIDCPNLETVRFTKLATIPTKNSVSYTNFYYAFHDCQALKDIYFNAVNTSTFTGGYSYVFNSMFNTNTGKTYGCTVHFPSNMQTTISGLNGYPTFGGSALRITIAFDLPATS